MVDLWYDKQKQTLRCLRLGFNKMKLIARNKQSYPKLTK